MAILPEDDMFHERTDNPYWNESAWFQVPLPQHNMNGWIYFYHRPNMNLSAGGAAFYDPTGEDVYNARYYQWNEHQPLPAGANMHDFTLDNGLTVETGELLKHYNFRYKNEHISLDVEWRANMDPSEFVIPSPEMIERLGLRDLMAKLQEVNPGVNPMLEGYGNSHYECGGHMTGTVTISGETYEVDAPALRDHSWGPRKTYQHMPRASWGWVLADDQSSFQWSAMSLVPIDSDPIIGTTEHIVMGWYTKDGVQAALSEGTRKVLERGPDGRPLRVLVEATDTMGRQARAVGRLKTLLKFPCYAVVFAWDALYDWEFEGQTIPGEEMEYFHTTRRDRRFPQYNELAWAT